MWRKEEEEEERKGWLKDEEEEEMKEVGEGRVEAVGGGRGNEGGKE